MELKFRTAILLYRLKGVLIVPLWNWNGMWVKLKCAISKSFNRTFMELKYVRNKRRKTDQNVLIVPLWNWNVQASVFAILNESFNRTFMELK